MTSLNKDEQNKIINAYLEKYKKETLNKVEGEKLKQLLKEKQEEAFSTDDKILAIGLGFLIAGLIGYLVFKD